MAFILPNNKPPSEKPMISWFNQKKDKNLCKFFSLKKNSAMEKPIDPPPLLN